MTEKIFHCRKYSMSGKLDSMPMDLSEIENLSFLKSQKQIFDLHKVSLR